MSLERKKLRDLCSIITKGTTPSSIGEAFIPQGATTAASVKFIRSEMLTSARHVSGNFLYISDEAHQKLNRSQLRSGDILFSMAGIYLGKTALLRPEDVPANTNQAVALIRIDPAKCSNEFIYYYLNLPEVIQYVNMLPSQSAQPNINLRQIGNLDIQLPELSTQKKIVGMLSVYDDLIENNSRQISLLEEAAQRLYKEWFINLRFPGCTHTRTAACIPEGWRAGTLLELAKFKHGNTIRKSEITRGDIPVISGGLGPAYYHNAANTSAPVITISASGANAGFVRMHHTDIFASDCSFADSTASTALPFVYCFLANNRSRLASLQKGSAQPHVYAKDINALRLSIPPQSLVDRFCQYSGAFFSQIGLLERQSQRLEQARNYLLPKLISGKVKV